MSNHEKAAYILDVLSRIKLSRPVVLLQPEDIVKKCRNSDELNFYYQKLCVRK